MSAIAKGTNRKPQKLRIVIFCICVIFAIVLVALVSISGSITATKRPISELNDAALMLKIEAGMNEYEQRHVQMQKSGKVYWSDDCFVVTNGWKQDEKLIVIPVMVNDVRDVGTVGWVNWLTRLDFLTLSPHTSGASNLKLENVEMQMTANENTHIQTDHETLNKENGNLVQTVLTKENLKNRDYTEAVKALVVDSDAMPNEQTKVSMVWRGFFRSGGFLNWMVKVPFEFSVDVEYLNNVKDG